VFATFTVSKFSHFIAHIAVFCLHSECCLTSNGHMSQKNFNYMDQYVLVIAPNCMSLISGYMLRQAGVAS